MILIAILQQYVDNTNSYNNNNNDNNDNTNDNNNVIISLRAPRPASRERFRRGTACGRRASNGGPDFRLHSASWLLGFSDSFGFVESAAPLSPYNVE